MDSLSRLYVVTGKGGVGKTAYSLALAAYLKNKNIKVLYNDFDQEGNYNIIENLAIPHLDLNTRDSAEIYIAKKLKSKILASWIMKTPFFLALFNMIPGLGQLILLGHLVDLLEQDPKLHIIVDSPSSGHALTMLEATHNFKNIFKKGPLVDDIERMHKLLYASGGLQIIILGLPHEMSITEAQELSKQLEEMNYKNIKFIINDCFSKVPELCENEKELPDFLRQKLKLESAILDKHQEKKFIKHLSASTLEETVEQMTKLVEETLD